MMRLSAAFALVLMLAAPGAAAGQSPTLESVRERGVLLCGVNPGQTGMAVRNETGAWDGMGVDLCRAFAAATLGEPNAVEFVPVTARTRFPALQSGEIDILVRTTTWTYNRDTAFGVDFIATYFMETERILVTAESGLETFADLDGQPICVIAGSITENIVRNRQDAAGVTIEPVPVADVAGYTEAYREGRCVGVADGAAGLTALRTGLDDPGAHRFITEELAISPLSIAVRHGDDAWEDIVRWTFFALLEAERLGVTQINAQRMARESRHPIVRRIFNAEGGSGEALGLEPDWALRAVQGVGHYGEIYDRAFGPNGALPIERGKNRIWSEGGMLFTAPFE
ncbi:MAG: transporter substrate-binding domain-containing protein [Alphaproteobacteria bacterium]|nr:transporter substrate-binding domain-containing protein [Alphaproteobacteria bacterium]